MSLASGTHDDTVVIHVGPQLVTSTRLELKTAVLDALERGARRFRLDFSRTGFVDSAGLGLLISLSKQVRERGGELRIANLNADLRLLFKLTKLDLLFRMDDGGDGPAGAGVPAPVPPMEPFTLSEIAAALRLLLDEADALELAEGADAIGEETWTHQPVGGYPPDEEAFIRLASMNLSEDTLILLALASEKGARTIPAFRQWRQRVSRATDEWQASDDAVWTARFAQLAAALGTNSD